MRRRLGRAAVQMLRNGMVERVVDQRGFAGTRNARHADEQADRQVRGSVFQIVAACAGEPQHLLRLRLVAQLRRRDVATPGQDIVR